MFSPADIVAGVARLVTYVRRANSWETISRLKDVNGKRRKRHAVLGIRKLRRWSWTYLFRPNVPGGERTRAPGTLVKGMLARS